MSCTHRPSSAHTPSYNRLHRFSECRRRYYYAYVLAVEPTADDETKLRAGSAGHAGMDPLHRLGWDALPLARTALSESWAGYAPQRLQWMSERHLLSVLDAYVVWAQQQPALSPVLLSEQQLKSCKAFMGGSYQLDAAGNVMLTEPSLDVEIADGLVVQIVPDWVARDERGALWLVDNKWTTDYLGDPLTKRVRFSKQMPLYVAGLERLLDEPIEGAIINAVYMGEYATKDSSTAVRFARYGFDYTPSMLADAIGFAREGRAQMLAAEAADGEDVQRWLQHGGRHCSWCPYSQLCEVSGAQRAGRLRASYRPKERADVDGE